MGFSVSLRLRGAGFNFLATVCVRGPPPLLPGVRWPLAGVWRAGGGPSGGVRWLVLVRTSVSAPCFGVVVCCGSPCCAVPCIAVLRRAGPCRVAVRPPRPRRVALCCAVVCRSVPCRVASCCGVLCLGGLVVVRCTVLLCGAVCRAAPCCAVVGWWRSVRPVSWCGVRDGVWPGGAVRCGVARWVCAVGVWARRSGSWVG